MSSGGPAPADQMAPSEQPQTHYVLRLYIAGDGAKSVTALRNLQLICKHHVDGICEIEVIDLVQSPRRASEDQILAIPTLVRALPQPPKRIIGDLSNTEKVLAGLSIAHQGISQEASHQ